MGTTLWRDKNWPILVFMNICTADTAPCNVDQNVVGDGDWAVNVFYADTLLIVETCSSHCHRDHHSWIDDARFPRNTARLTCGTETKQLNNVERQTMINTTGHAHAWLWNPG